MKIFGVRRAGGRRRLISAGVLAFFVATAGSVNADGPRPSGATLSVYDANGKTVAPVIGALDRTTFAFALKLGAAKYVLLIDTPDLPLLGTSRSEVMFTTADCSGPGYLAEIPYDERGTLPLTAVGPPGMTLYAVEPAVVAVERPIRSYGVYLALTGEWRCHNAYGDGVTVRVLPAAALTDLQTFYRFPFEVR